MAIGKVRYLNNDEVVQTKKWVSRLPKSLKDKYILHRQPFTITQVDDYFEGVLSMKIGDGLPSDWREKCEDLIINMQLEGVTILVPPKHGEFPRDILPFAWGHKLMEVLTFLHMNEILELVSKTNENENLKNTATTHFVIAGGDVHNVANLTYFMPTEVNHLSFFHNDIDELEQLQDYFFAKRGLPTEIFASPKNPSLTNADVVILCHNSIISYEHILKENAIFIDIIGNPTITKNLKERRPDVTIIDGFNYIRNQQIYSFEEWEARIYNRHRKVRKFLIGEEYGNREILKYFKNLNLEVKSLICLGEVFAEREILEQTELITDKT